MSSTLLYNPINPSIALLSRSHFPVLVCRYFPMEICHSITHKSALARTFTRVRATAAEALKIRQSEGDGNSKSQDKNLRILVAGGGIGGLVFALVTKKKRFDVAMFERDLSAISVSAGIEVRFKIRAMLWLLWRPLIWMSLKRLWKLGVSLVIGLMAWLMGFLVTWEVLVEKRKENFS